MHYEVGIFILVIVLLAYFGVKSLFYPGRAFLRLVAFILSSPLEKNLSFLLNSTIFDTLDCVSWITGLNCNADEYQSQDKLLDNLVRLYYLIQKPHWYLYVAYIYRTIGEILYWWGFIKRDGFILFPDLYQVLYFTDLFEGKEKIYLPIAIAAKMGQEVYLHSKGRFSKKRYKPPTYLTDKINRQISKWI